MNADGSEPIRLTTHPAADSHPSVSPDGLRIAFQSDRDGNSEIYVMRVDGSDPVNVTGSGASDEHPSWSPDGTKILFTSRRDGSSDIFVMNADGSDPINLTRSPSSDRTAAWSPDGSRIALSSDDALYVMNADGSNPVKISYNFYVNASEPAWSPDGKRIAYTEHFGPSNRGGDIVVMPADGNVEGRVHRKLTNSQFADNRWPSWSPDGLHILYTTRRMGSQEVFVMNADGSEHYNLSASPSSADITGSPSSWISD
jgi:Tol biopolymer transport system component